MNGYGIKKWMGLFMIVVMTVMAHLLVQLMVPIKDIFSPLLASVGAGAAMMIVTSMMLKHPYTEMIEGKGALLKDINSSGRISNFIAKINLPLLTLKDRGKEYSTVFDRGIVGYEQPPQPADYAEDEKYAYYRVSKVNFQKSIYSENNFLTILWNGKMKAPLTKDALNNIETSTIVDHQILYLNHKVDEMSGYIRDFARYIVEQFKPKSQGMFGGNMVIYIIIAIAIIAVVVLMGPTVIKIFTQSGGTLLNSVGNAAGASAISPVK